MNIFPNIQKFIDDYNEAYKKVCNGEAKMNDENEEMILNVELYLAKAILNDSPYEDSSNNLAVKAAKIILAATGEDNLIRIGTEFKFK
jgi:hypothetical protein